MSGWFRDHRIEWIAEIVRVYGFINREHVERKFQVSTPQSSYDIRDAMERYPNLMRYNPSTKRYEAIEP